MFFDPLSGWGELALALAAFIGSHVIPSRQPVRARLTAIAGERAYLVAYSVLSLLPLGWLIQASANAPYVELWPYADWQRLVPQLAMPPALALAVFGLTSPNPLSIGRRRGTRFDPEHPGIAGIVRHPVLWATLLWSVSHLVPNGDLAHAILFGVFTALSIAGMLLLDRRSRRRLGEAEWRSLSRNTSNLPFAPLRRGRVPRPDLSVVVKLAAALALYLLLLFTHPYFAGVPALAA